MQFSDEEIKATILYNLRRKRKIGGAHTHFDTLKRGFPSHLGKDVKNLANEIIKEGLILTKSTPYGLQVWLNKDRIGEIEAYILKVLNLKV
ncbi:MAG TPA: hypothetical protein VJC07_00125 [Candidatus Nanoarchaeia archaeon]|nr:hypothetical protein [Candidatus Nanoarchaeia archaeon]